MTNALPHDEYIEAVAEAFTHLGLRVTADTTTPDSQQLEAWIRFDPADIDTDTWEDGVYLGWDPQRGWHLIEDGGGRNVRDLDPEGVATVWAHPQQVAASAVNALAGQLSTGPICIEEPWDSRPVEAAVKAWQADES
jgi:hypothetical protein